MVPEDQGADPRGRRDLLEGQGGSTLLASRPIFFYHQQVVLTADLFVDGFWPALDRDRGSRRPIKVNFVGTSQAGALR